MEYNSEHKAKKLVKVLIPVARQKNIGPNQYFIDFGKAAFGTIELSLPEVKKSESITIHLGESIKARDSLNRNPEGSVLYRKMTLDLEPGILNYVLKIPSEKRNTGRGAILMPEDLGEVMPFRYCELENMTSSEFTISQVMVHYPFDDSASHFSSSDPTLDAVWEFCKYSIKATSFCGIYVDGDRERIPYEGDAYINQLCHYSVDQEYSMARQTQIYLLKYPTWPTEWHMHMVLMAWADWMYTADSSFLKEHYEILKLKSLIDLSRQDGLISTQSSLCTPQYEKTLNLHNEKYVYTHGLKDLVDWPPGSFTTGGQGERDNHEMMPVNTVVNAFHYRALILMSRIAQTIGRGEDHSLFQKQANKVKDSFNDVFFDKSTGLYVDGEGSCHSSLHSNKFALVFGLVPDERKIKIIQFVKSRGMACSVYGAQFLLEALYMNEEDEYALELLTSRSDRSWLNMIASGSTIAMEAWDWKYKNNLDWNHAWGAVPANIIPRYLMGIRPLEAGFRKIQIKPRPGHLKNAKCLFPSPRGPVSVEFQTSAIGIKNWKIKIPADMTAKIDLPGLGAFLTEPGRCTYLFEL